MCWSLFLIELQVCKVIKEASTQVFSGEDCKVFKNTIFYRTPLVAASTFTFSKIFCSKILLSHIQECLKEPHICSVKLQMKKFFPHSFEKAVAFCEMLNECYNQYYCRKRSVAWNWLMTVRSSCQEVFYKNGVLENFATLTGKHLRRVSFLKKLQA